MSCSKRLVPVTWTLLLLAGCSGESPDDVATVSSALRYDNHSIATPAYFGGTEASYDALTAPNANPHGNAVAIVNAGCDHSGARVNPSDPMSPCVIAGGPGAVKDTYIEGQIAQLHAAGVTVFGYVWFGGNPPGSPTVYRSTTDLLDDLSAWYSYGSSAADRLDGIFFDGFTRATTGGLPQAEYMADVVQSWFKFNEWRGFWTNWPGRAVFNWGNTPSQMQQYVECLILRNATDQNDQTHWNYFVLHETYQSWFFGLSWTLPTWLQNRFNPFHFMTMVHSASPDGSSVPLILYKSRNLNAAFTYITDRSLSSNPWAAPPGAGIWNPLLNALNAGPYEYPNGTDWDEMPASCPAADTATPSYP